MSLFEKLRGTIESIFQLGIGGPQLKNNAGVIEGRNADDTGYAVLRGAAPVGDNDLVNKIYADSLSKPIIVSRQADTSVSLPSNTAVRGYVVVTTAGSGAALGDLLYDDGSNTGTMQILTALEGRTIAVTDTLAGGDISFDADSIYIWDADGSAWVKIGDIGNVSGAVREIRFLIDNTASQDSVTQLPGNARVIHASLEITTAYSGGATITLGTTTTADLFMSATDNNPQTGATPRTFAVNQDTAVGGVASVVRATVSGAPAAGAGVVVVRYTVPNA